MSTADLTPAALRWRFLALKGMRWFPTGLIIPVAVLLMLQRGLSLGQIGWVMAAQGAVIMLLELPTGGLADALGRRPVLLLGSSIALLAKSLMVVADEVWMFAAVFALTGVYRALDSGPLDSWFVDASQAADPDADIERGLAGAGVATGVGIATGTLLSSGLVLVEPGPLDPLATPIAVAAVMRALELIAISRLMVEVRPARGMAALRQVMSDVPDVLRSATRSVRSIPVLRVLIAVELLWGFGMIAFENFTPARLEQVTASADRAAALMGPAHTAGWLAAAGGAAVVGSLTRRVGAPRAGTVLLGIQAAMVAAIGLLAGPIGIITAFVATMAVHGAANPVHQGMLHRAVADPGQRATVVSVNSLTASLGGAAGGIVLGAVADGLTLTTAIIAGAVVLAAAGLLYLRIRRTDVALPPTARRGGGRGPQATSGSPG